MLWKMSFAANSVISAFFNFSAAVLAACRSIDQTQIRRGGRIVMLLRFIKPFNFHWRPPFGSFQHDAMSANNVSNRRATKGMLASSCSTVVSVVTSNRKLSCTCGSVWLVRSTYLRSARPPGASILGHRAEKIILDPARSQAPSQRAATPTISRHQQRAAPRRP